MIYNYRVSAPGLLDGAYAGVSLVAARTGGTLIGADRPSTRLDSSLYFAVDAPSGPVCLAYDHGDGNNQAVYFFLGRP